MCRKLGNFFLLNDVGKSPKTLRKRYENFTATAVICKHFENVAACVHCKRCLGYVGGLSVEIGSHVDNDNTAE